jgi:MFS family permease
MSARNAPRKVASQTLRATRWGWRLARGRVVQFVGGPARTRVVVLFGCVLALSSAQISTVGAVAPQLESSLHLDNTKIGLLNTVTLLVAAVSVIPVGLIVDRIKRIPMLSISIVLWSIATIMGAVAGSYGSLLLTRILLGVVSASAGPAIASLTGDYFPSSERGRVYGYILTGEILGTAIGFVICGNVSSAFGWRASFWVLGIPGFFLARSLWRTVPEPLRGGHSRLERGVMDLRRPGPDDRASAAAGEMPLPPDHDLAYEMAEQQGYRPNPKLVLNRDPDTMSLRDAVRYVLSIPTNVMLIISSSLGYFFFSGLQTFAIVFVRGHFHTGQSEATLVLGVLVLGAIVGTLLAGPVCDFLTGHGRLASRVWVPAICQIAAGIVLIPGLLTSNLGTALPFCFLGTAFISAANPPLDAARLDIVPSGLWGRAESTRTFLRSIAQAVAPLAFGGVADLVAGFTPRQAPVGTHVDHVASGSGTGLQVSFLIMLVSLFGAGWFLWRARGEYPRDVATAAAGWSPLTRDSRPTADDVSARPRRRAADVMVTDMRTEDPTVVAGDTSTRATRIADEPETRVHDDPDATRVADDPDATRRTRRIGPARSDDATRVADEDPTEVKRDDDDGTEPLFWRRDD